MAWPPLVSVSRGKTGESEHRGMGGYRRKLQGIRRKRKIGYLSKLQDYRQFAFKKPVKLPQKSLTLRKPVPVRLPKKIPKFGRKISSEVRRRARPAKNRSHRRTQLRPGQLQLNPAAALVFGLPGLLGKFTKLSPGVSLIFHSGLGAGLAYLASVNGNTFANVSVVASPVTTVTQTQTNTNTPMITNTLTNTPMVTNTNNDNDVNTATSNNVVTNTGNTVTVNNNNGRKKKRKKRDYPAWVLV